MPLEVGDYVYFCADWMGNHVGDMAVVDMLGQDIALVKRVSDCVSLDPGCRFEYEWVPASCLLKI